MTTARPRVHAPVNPGLALAAALALALALFALTAPPRAALAKSYEMTSVEITASVLGNGDVDVIEYRTFNFDGSFSSVHWTIPLANAQGVDVWGMGEYDEDAGNLLYVGEAKGAREGTSSLLNASSLTDAGALDWDAVFSSQTTVATNGTFELTSDGANLEARLRFSKEDTSATFWIAYTIEGGAKAWADTGDVTWQAVGAGWGEASQDVSVTLQLPVPDGTDVTLGDNVRAWADGPLDGVISLNDDGTLSFTCPYVASGQYLSIMVAFPVAWLTEEVTPSSEEHLDAMLAMGQAIADSANAERDRARLILYAAIAASVVVTAGVVVLLVAKFRKYGKEYKTSFNDKYWRDMPSDDHPAVIGALWRWGETKDEDLTASLMRLTQMGALKMERVSTTQTGLLGRTKVKDDYRLTEVPGFDRDRLDDIDKAALDLVLGLMGRDSDADDELDEQGAGNSETRGASGAAGQPGCSALFSELAANAKENPLQFDRHRSAWTAAVQAAVNDRDAYEAGGELWHGRARFIGGLLILAAIFTFVGGDYVGFLPGAILIAGGAFCYVIAPKMRRRSAEANETVAKTKALRNWLCDFTNLKEAVPGDVVLWGKMLVLAVVLGVSDRVVEQLKLAAPQLLESPDLMPYYIWYMPYNGMTPAAAFGTAAAEAHRLSSAEIAQTSSSSGDGSGGGFGGGGFGSSFGGSSFGGGGGGAD